MGKPQDVVNKAAMTLLLVQRGRLRLENAELAEIRDKLVQNEEDLDKGRVQLNKALERLDQVEGVLNAAASFLDIIGRVVSLV